MVGLGWQRVSVGGEKSFLSILRGEESLAIFVSDFCLSDIPENPTSDIRTQQIEKGIV